MVFDLLLKWVILYTLFSPNFASIKFHEIRDYLISWFLGIYRDF